jgi:hypothetical protein
LARRDIGEASAKEGMGGSERRLGQGTPQQLRQDIQNYQGMGIPVIVCNFATPNVQGLWTAMETFATEVMAYFLEPA